MQLIDDTICLLLQKYVNKKLNNNGKANSFKPYKEPGRIELEEGIVCLNDISYGSTYPNSFLDIWYPSARNNTKCPVMVYFHGGGFCMGDKSSGDPLSAGKENGSKLLLEIVKEGYILLNASYCLAPQYRFPSQIYQVDEVMRFILDNADYYGFDTNNIIIGGASAGANMTAIYATAICNPNYADILGLNPFVKAKSVKALFINEAALDSEHFNQSMNILTNGWLGKNIKNNKDLKNRISATDYILQEFIPTFINTSNMEDWFVLYAKRLHEKLDSINVPNELIYFDKDVEELQHGYMDLLGKSICANQAFEQLLLFLEEYVKR
ncbi:MAG: alpha/beta hydrolase [Pseudobutyrivibrio sp.]|nr:alpha/beta hydrolase [Pseudobutyrivibrio sp.]